LGTTTKISFSGWRRRGREEALPRSRLTDTMGHKGIVCSAQYNASWRGRPGKITLIVHTEKDRKLRKTEGLVRQMDRGSRKRDRIDRKQRRWCTFGGPEGVIGIGWQRERRGG